MAQSIESRPHVLLRISLTSLGLLAHWRFQRLFFAPVLPAHTCRWPELSQSGVVSFCLSYRGYFALDQLALSAGKFEAHCLVRFCARLSVAVLHQSCDTTLPLQRRAQTQATRLLLHTLHLHFPLIKLVSNLMRENCSGGKAQTGDRGGEGAGCVVFGSEF